MELLDEIRGKLRAIQWEPTLDPEGRRAVALERLIRRIQVVEAEALRDQRDVRSAESAGQVRPTERYLGVRRPYLSGVHTGGRTQNSDPGYKRGLPQAATASSRGADPAGRGPCVARD